MTVKEACERLSSLAFIEELDKIAEEKDSFLGLGQAARMARAIKGGAASVGGTIGRGTARSAATTPVRSGVARRMAQRAAGGGRAGATGLIG